MVLENVIENEGKTIKNLESILLHGSHICMVFIVLNRRWSLVVRSQNLKPLEYVINVNLKVSFITTCVQLACAWGYDSKIYSPLTLSGLGRFFIFSFHKPLYQQILSEGVKYASKLKFSPRMLDIKWKSSELIKQSNW